MDPVNAARSREEAAFLELMDEHYLPLFRFAYRMTGSAEEAEDVVQECFLELLRPQCRYDPRRTSVRTYLFGIVRNQSLKRLRKKDQTAPDDQTPSHHPSPERGLLRAELEQAIARAVRELPETQREVLVLAHYEQMPLAEIASVLAIDVAAVKSRLQRARASLKKTLAAFAPGMERRP